MDVSELEEIKAEKDEALKMYFDHKTTETKKDYTDKATRVLEMMDFL